MATEKRKATRRALDRFCWIQCAPDRVIQATLINISHTGAKLTLPDDTPELPKRFDLLLTWDGTVGRKAELAWRSETELGLRFVSRHVARPVRPEPDADAVASGAKKLA